jgi:hypothetical protein
VPQRETRSEREERTLAAGARAARRRMTRREGQKRSERPDDFLSVYSALEDALFSLYSAVQQGQLDKITRDSGDIIVLASVAAEKAEEALSLKRLESLAKKQAKQG